MNKLQIKIDSPIGPLFLVASDLGLQSILWSLQKQIPLLQKAQAKTPAARHLQQAEAELGEYFAGLRRTFHLSLDVGGTEFQKRVWEELKKIPYASTVSYKDLAVRLKDKNACRAVGTANGKNPISIVVPCHRVITSSGTLGGYSGGLDIKTKLLELEKKTVLSGR